MADNYGAKVEGLPPEVVLDSNWRQGIWSATQTREYFIQLAGVYRGINDEWLVPTSQFLNYKGMTPEEARAFLQGLRAKATKAKARFGPKGPGWDFSLSSDEEELVAYLRFQRERTNSGIEDYVDECFKAMIDAGTPTPPESTQK